MASRPKPQPLPQAPSRGRELVIPLREIAGLDPCNTRQDEPSAESIEAMARDIAAHGQIHPVLVRGTPGLGFRLIDGGRRWRALCWLEDHGEPQPSISICLFDGDDAAARAFSLAANVQREDLHPLAEAEQFAELARLDPASRIAREFGRSKRYVRQRIRLAALPPAAKLAWREGRLGLAAAQALADCDDPQKITDLVESKPDWLDDALEIKRALRPRGVLSVSPKAVFVGLEAYVQAGGFVQSNLFDDAEWLTDVDLLNRLANQKLSAEGQRVCDEEGWGNLYFDYPALECVDPDFTEAELAELAHEPAKAREAEIHRLGFLRAVPEERRATHGIYVWIDADGQFAVDRGFRPFAGSSPQTPSGAASSPVSAPSAGDEVFSAPLSRPGEGPGVKAFDAESFEQTAAAATRQHFAPRQISGDLNPGALALAHVAASRAIASMVAGDVRVAKILVVAQALRASMGLVQLRRLQGNWGAERDDLRALLRKTLRGALDWAAGLGKDELDEIFCAVVASSIRLDAEPNEARGFVAFARELFESRFEAAFADQVNWTELFRRGGLPLARAAIRDGVGEAGLAERAHLGAAELIDEGALLARASKWLPQMWRD